MEMVRNQRGEKVAEFISGEFGLGLVEFTPITGRVYVRFLGGKQFRYEMAVAGTGEFRNCHEGKHKLQNEMNEVSLEGRGLQIKSWFAVGNYE